MNKIELKEYPFRENERYLLEMADDNTTKINYAVGTYINNTFVDYKGDDIDNEIIGYILLKDIIEEVN